MSVNNNWKKFILWFAQEHIDFRLAEFESIVQLFGIKYRNLTNNHLKPFWIVEFPNDEAAYLFASRSVSLRCILEFWSHGTNFKHFQEQISVYIKENSLNVSKYFVPDIKFKITVETYNKHFTQREKVEKIENLDVLPVKGTVDLKTPEVEWLLIEFWGLNPNEVPNLPEDILFGRLLTQGQRQLIEELSLKKRKFIGNTSMNAQLSLLMANQALVTENDLVFDPFVGTGSLLVSAAKFGAYVLGADIDFMMLHARCRPSRITQKVREKDESIRANLKQYGCEKYYMDVIVSDFSNKVWHEGFKLDSIITDPPYGVREATEKVETKISKKLNTNSGSMPHYPSTSPYTLQLLYADLLKFGAEHLKIGGRLVCWLPFHREDYNPKMLPQHSCLNLVANSEQLLVASISRRLLTYEKIAEPDMEKALESLVITTPMTSGDFRERYFDSGLETRKERRQRKAEIRERARLEALKRGIIVQDLREYKCNLNRARFD